MVVRTSLRRFASQALVDFSAAPPGLRECVRVIPEFVTRDEERALAAELDPIFARQRYRRDHWDGVITGYKETERHAWAREENAAVVERARRAITAGGDDVTAWLPTHAIELEPSGEIRPHVDSVKFSGGFVAGVSLLSAAIMTLERADAGAERAADTVDTVRLLLPPRSLYVLSGAARFEFTHRIGGGAFGGAPVERGRRLSLIFRDAKDG